MQNEIDVLVDKFIDIVKDVVKEKQVRSIKQYHRDRRKGYKTISCVIEYEQFKVRFAYHVNEGIVFKKGIITMYFNIKSLEYHISDILAQIAPRDKDIMMFPYVDNESTMKSCVEILWNKLQKYNDKIIELSTNDELISRLERTLKKEIKIFSGKDLPKEGPLALMLSGIYSNTSLIRYTSEPYECFVNGNYSKAIRLYNKESNLALYEYQLVKFMKRAIKQKKKVDIPDEQKTINHVKNIKRNSRVYSILSFILLLPLMFGISLALSKLFANVITKNADLVLFRDIIFLSVPTVALSVAFTQKLRNYLFKKKLASVFQYDVLVNTEKQKKIKKSIFNSIIISSILTIAIISASSISFRVDGIKYSTDILDFKGTIVPYKEVQSLDKEALKIILENGEEISFETFSYNNDDVNKIEQIIENKKSSLE